MAEEKIKKPNPGYFKKKEAKPDVEIKLEEPAAQAAESSEELKELSQHESTVDAQPKQEVNMRELVRDLMFNRYFHIMEKEAKPIAEKMVNEGSETLHEVKWFLAHSERVQLAKELAQKYGLS